ncbi:ABC transporter permease [Ornithinimicrobium sp. Y1847]|uniref:ABC transporter permease n=1 Tax=Ornithinimicrobium sp. Y1847 TaxID=3405419 RepID=UPI003B677403
MAAGWMLSGLASRGRRLVAAAIAIVIGTAFLTASLAMLATAQAGIEDQVAAGVRDADLVASPTDMWLGAADLDAVAALPETAEVDAPAMVYLSQGNSFIIGATMPPAATLVEGQLPTGPREIAVTEQTAEGGTGIGDTLSLEPMPAIDASTGEPVDAAADPDPIEVSVVGVVNPGELGPLSYGRGFVAPDALLRELDPGLMYDQLLIHTADGVGVDAARSAVATVLPTAQLLTGPEAAQQAVDQMTGETAVLSAILLGFGAVALVTAAIVIANTFMITLAQRAGELALLRCVGGSRTQVRRLVLIEALLLGVVASAIGIGVGMALAAGLLAWARAAEIGIPLGTSLSIPVTAIVLPLIAGTVITLLAALVPAHRATRVSPLAALRPTGESSERARTPWWRVGAGALAFALGCALMVYAATGRDMMSGVLGGVVSFAGVLLMAVVVVPLAVRTLGLGARAAGVPGRLAVDNAVRNPGRAAATSAALLVGVTLITMTTIGAATGERTALGEIDDAFAVDLVATAPNDVAPDDSTPISGTIDRATLAQVSEVEGVEAARLVETAYLRLGQQDYPTLALGLDQGSSDVVRSAPQLAELTPGTVGLSNTLQAIHGLKVGDTIEVSGPGGSRELTVFEMGMGNNLAMNAEDVRALGGDEVGQQAVLIKVSDDTLGSTMSGLNEIAAGDASLTIQGSASERAVITQVLDVLVLVTTALLGVSVLIAVVGIANTLSLSVIERHREHALLRGLGLTRGQMRSMLLTEGVLLAVVSALIGLALGLLYAWLGVQTVLPDGTDVRLGIPWARLGLILGVALLAGVLASVLPARRAARVTPAEGLATA